MASCLGIYISKDIITYAKLSISNSKEVEIEKYGIRFVKSSKKDVINSLIEETDSKDIPTVINPENDVLLDIQILEQAQSKSYINDVIKMEFESWCEKNQKDSSKYSYVYTVSELKSQDNKYNAVIDIMDRKNITDQEQYTNKIASIFPPQFMMHKLVPHEEEDYVLVNLDSKLSITTVIGKKMIDIKNYDIGMEYILSEISTKLGSYQKAYEACRQLNVYSEGQTVNDPTLEGITEQVLQEVLKYVLVVVNKNRKNISKVIITGMGTVFTNIDVLFTEFLDIKSEILKPDFISRKSSIKNMAEVVETIESIALAYGYLNQENKKLDHMTKKTISSSSIKGIFSGLVRNKNNNSTKVSKNRAPPINFDFSKYSTYTIAASIVLVIVLIGYCIFGNVYSSTIDGIIKTIDEKDKAIITKINEVNNDISYIGTNVSEYSSVNSEVEKLIQQIEGNEVGRISTYNVASFLGSIIKIIPKNVVLKNIKSDDNKNVTITAQSDSYADLGYFIAQLKLQMVLRNIKINNIQNGTSITVQIGGELP